MNTGKSLIELCDLCSKYQLTPTELAAETQISRQTWSSVLDGRSPVKAFHLTLARDLAQKKTLLSPVSASNAPGFRDPYQRLSFPAPKCPKHCGSKCQRVRREVVGRGTIYAWRCAKARRGECDATRFWTDAFGRVISRPSHRSPLKNVGVSRPKCGTCNQQMQFVEKRQHKILGPLWRWRCRGVTASRHQSQELITDYRGAHIVLPRARRWGNYPLPFEFRRLRDLPANANAQRKLTVFEKCSTCGSVLEADRRGTARWRLRCEKQCEPPFFVDASGRRINLQRLGIPRQALPKKARKCPDAGCGKFLTLGGDRWRNKNPGKYPTTLVQLACIENGKRRHPGATWYFDLTADKFLSKNAMKSGQPRGNCDVRKRCCGRLMWATLVKATRLLPAHWAQSCANAACKKGRQRKRKYLKVGLDGKVLRWMKRGVVRRQKELTLAPIQVLDSS